MNISTCSMYCGLFAQDVDSVLFISWAISYHERMTKSKAIVTIVSIKIFSIAAVSITSIFMERSCTMDINCALYSLEAFFFQTIPYIVYFLGSIFVICYISCKKYHLSNEVVPLPNFQENQTPLSDFGEKIKKYFKLNIWTLLLMCLLMPENIARVLILALKVNCEDTGSYTGFLLSFQSIFTVLYPILIKHRLKKYH